MIRTLPVALVLALIACGGKSEADDDDDGGAEDSGGDTPDTDGPGGGPDGDGDGYSADEGDCDDEDPNIGPTATDIVGDGIDQNCDGVDGTDADGDGHASSTSGGDDCDDTDAAVSPSTTEIPYDGVDNDCLDGDLVDQDGDGYAGGEDGADCDDSDPAVNPGATDEPYDGVDSDCGGGDDYDADEDGVPVWDDCDDDDATLFLGAAVNEPSICTRDADGDGWGDMYVNGGSDCDDTDSEQYEIAKEGVYVGQVSTAGTPDPVDWEISLVGNTWLYDGSQYGTVDQYGIVDSYERPGCEPSWGTCSATGFVCGDSMSITITLNPLSSGTRTMRFEGTFSE